MLFISVYFARGGFRMEISCVRMRCANVSFALKIGGCTKISCAWKVGGSVSTVETLERHMEKASCMLRAWVVDTLGKKSRHHEMPEYLNHQWTDKNIFNQTLVGDAALHSGSGQCSTIRQQNISSLNANLSQNVAWRLGSHSVFEWELNVWKRKYCYTFPPLCLLFGFDSRTASIAMLFISRSFFTGFSQFTQVYVSQVWLVGVVEAFAFACTYVNLRKLPGCVWQQCSPVYCDNSMLHEVPPRYKKNDTPCAVSKGSPALRISKEVSLLVTNYEEHNSQSGVNFCPVCPQHAN